MRQIKEILIKEDHWWPEVNGELGYAYTLEPGGYDYDHEGD